MATLLANHFIFISTINTELSLFTFVKLAIWAFHFHALLNIFSSLKWCEGNLEGYMKNILITFRCQLL